MLTYVALCDHIYIYENQVPILLTYLDHQQIGWLCFRVD